MREQEDIRRADRKALPKFLLFVLWPVLRLALALFFCWVSRAWSGSSAA